MANAKLKTKAGGADLTALLKKVTDAGRREDCLRLVAVMQEATGAPPRLWGTGIVGFGDVHLTYASGRELDWFLCGFAPRKDALAVYGIPREDPAAERLLGRLGTYTTAKGCLYVKRLGDVDLDVLGKLLRLASRKN